MDYRLKTIVLVCLIAVVQNVAAGDIFLTETQFIESYAKTVNVSGNIRTGVMYKSNSPNAGSILLFTGLGEYSGSLLEVRILSLDGKYSARIKRPLGDDIDGITRVHLPTEYEKTINEYEPHELAVYAEIILPDSDRDRFVIPASWGASSTSELQIFMNLGSDSNATIRVKDHDGSRYETPCAHINTHYSVAYDISCSIDSASNIDFSSIKIIRRSTGGRKKAYKISIVVN